MKMATISEHEKCSVVYYLSVDHDSDAFVINQVFCFTDGGTAHCRLTLKSEDCYETALTKMHDLVGSEREHSLMLSMIPSFDDEENAQ